MKNPDIYPFSYENFEALIRFYFFNNGITQVGSIKLVSIHEKVKPLGLNQFADILKVISENIEFFENKLSKPKHEISISNLCNYALEAFLGENSGSSYPRKLIVKELNKMLVNAEAI